MSQCKGSPAGDERRWINIAGADPPSAPQATLVVGYDRRPESQDALRVAAGLAERMDAELHVVHAVDLTDYPIDPDGFDWEQRARDALDEERAAVARSA